MKEEAVTDALLREFLLGKVNDAEREQIEGLFLIDAQARERVLALEQDLIEDYLEDNLTPEDKERFLARYAQTEDQRRELRISKSIKDWAVAEAGAPQTTAAAVSVWSRLWTRLRLRPVFFVPITVAIVIAVVLAVVWLNGRREQRRHLAIEQELAQLNSPASLREDPPQMSSFELKPVALRSESATDITPGNQAPIVELRLPWIQKERYSTYKAELHRIDDDKTFTIPDLQEDDQGLIRLRLQTSMLRRGSYLIQLRGFANDGTASSPAEYKFTVSR
jgi:hypothetical protein